MTAIKSKYSSSTSRACKLLISSLTLIAAASQCAANQTEVKNPPLIYNRLRHDRDYLQLFRNFQSKEPYEEKPIKIKLNSQPGRTLVDAYYENNQSYASDIIFDDLVLEALDRTYLSRMYLTNYYHYDDPEDRRKASDPRLVSPSKCARELKYLKTKLDQLTQSGGQAAIAPELAAFFDSFASQEPGILFGNYMWTGNWRQCSKRLVFDLDRANTSNSIAFQGRYCVASLRSDRWQAKIEQRAKDRVGTYFKSAAQQYDYKRFFRVQLGICLPESCDSTSFDRAELFDLIRQLAVRKLDEPFKSYTMVDLFCLPDETSELRQLDSSGRLFVLVALVWCSLIVAVTCYDVFKRPQSADCGKPTNTDKDVVDKLVAALSLTRNYARLTSFNSKLPRAESTSCSKDSSLDNQAKISAISYAAAPSSNQPAVSDLAFTDFFKAVCMPFIMFGHMGLWLTMQERFPLAFDKGYHSLVNVVFMIDWFFVLAGFITVYYMFVTRRVTRITIAQWAYSIFHRYWRLAPMYIIVFWFCRSIFEHTGQGPIWDYGTTNMTLRGTCKQESWLWPITLTSNFHPLYEECILPGWFFSITLQFYLITPFVIVGLAKWPTPTWLATISLILTSVAMRIHRYLTDPLAPHLDLIRPGFDIQTHTGRYLYALYEYPHYRIASYLTGLLAGHYTYMVLSGKWRSTFYQQAEDENLASKPKLMSADRANKANEFVCRRYIWLACACFLISMSWASWFITKLYPRSMDRYAKPMASFLFGISQPTVGLAFSMLLITFMLGQYEKLKSKLEHPIWTLLSRLNVSLLLIHSEIIHWNHENAERMSTWNYMDVFKDMLSLFCVTYPLALVCTLLLEYPLANLEREFIGNWLIRKSVDRSKLASKGANLDEKETCSELKKNCELINVISKK